MPIEQAQQGLYMVFPGWIGRRGWIGAFVSLCLAVAVFLISSSPVQAQLSGSTAEVATGAIDYSRLTWAAQSVIPVRLPQRLVYANNLASAGQFFGTGNYTTDATGQFATGYNVSILDSQYCAAALSCTIAYATAEALAPTSASIEQTYAWMTQLGGLEVYPYRANHLPQWINLTNQRPIYLVPWVDGGAGMGYEQALWDEGGYRYTIALKGGDAQWLTAMVESVFQ